MLSRTPNLTIFTKEVCAYFDREYHFLGKLTKMKQIRSVTYFITTFKKSTIRIEGLSNDLYNEWFITGLKDAIWAHVCMHHTVTWLHECKLELEDETILHATSLHAAIPNLLHPGDNPSLTQTLKFQKVSPTEMDEYQKQGLFYYCDEKYWSGHKFRKNNCSKLMSLRPPPHKRTFQVRSMNPRTHNQISPPPILSHIPWNRRNP